MNQNEFPRLLPGDPSSQQSGHREWIRFILPQVMARLNWQDGRRRVSELVKIVELERGGIVLEMDLEPPGDRPLVLVIESDGDVEGSFGLDLAGSPTRASGKVVVRFTFRSDADSAEAVATVRNRRAWPRVAVSRRVALVIWQDGLEMLSVRGELVDLSGGGAAVLLERVPPTDRAVWIHLEVGNRTTAGAEARLVGAREEAGGRHKVRFSFIGLCPFDIYQAAMGYWG